jgi:hypothetical protein
MQGIIPSEAQKLRRRLFKKAVRYAQKVYRHPAILDEARRRLRQPHRLFQALMKEWFLKRKEQNLWRERRLATCFNRFWHNSNPVKAIAGNRITALHADAKDRSLLKNSLYFFL